MFRNPGNTISRPSSVQQARAFGVLLLEFEQMMQ